MRVGSTARPVQARITQTRTDDGGDADAGGEELEHDQGQTGEQQQVGDRRAGDGVEQLVDERELGEADRRGRVDDEPGRSSVIASSVVSSVRPSTSWPSSTSTMLVIVGTPIVVDVAA